MKNIVKILSILFFSAAMIVSCMPDEYELGTVDITSSDLTEGKAFSIEHDAENPNIVYLKSLMDSKYTPLWSHPQGRSQEKLVTLKIPFEGTYNVQFGVETRGGIVYGDTVTFTIDNFYAGFVEDELWTLLTGGVESSKTWLLDLDADGVSKYFVGPLYFYGTEDSWESVALYDEGKSGDDVKSELGITDSWNWKADWPGNTWIMNAGDYGTMTFDLIGGAHVTVDHKMLDRVENGTFLLDTDNKTLSMTDASPLHDSGRDGQVINWGDLKLISLTENTMQLAALRDPDLSGDIACLLVYNFISKEYSDNWTPGEEEEPEPTLPDGWKDDVSQTINTTIVWKLSESNPIDWANLDGSMMNGWQAPEDYPDWLGTPDPSVYGDFSMTMNSVDSSVVFVTPDGTTTEGTYSLSDKGIYSFSIDVPTFTVISWASFAADANNQLRILQVEKDLSGNVTGMWLGARSSEKDEYMAYHLIPSGGGSESDPMQVWKSALVGKTFTPDVNWFVDWVGFPPDFEGGWTSSSTFGDDYTSNSWVWDENVRAVAESATLEFFMDDTDMKLTLSQTKEGEAYTATGDVVINTDDNILNINIPLVDYAGTAASWLPTTNTKSITGDTNDFYFVSHGGSNLGNIDTEGLWIGIISKSTAAGDDGDEVVIYHYVVK